MTAWIIQALLVVSRLDQISWDRQGDRPERSCAASTRGRREVEGLRMRAGYLETIERVDRELLVGNEGRRERGRVVEWLMERRRRRRWFASRWK